MKLFVLLKDDVKVVAITEDEDHLLDYIGQRNLNLKHYGYFKVKGKDAERYALNFEELYLRFNNDIESFITGEEELVIDNRMKEEAVKFLDVCKGLAHIIQNTKLRHKDKKTLDEACAILWSSVRDTEQFQKIIDLDGLFDLLSKDNGQNISELMKHTYSASREAMKNL